MNLPDDARAEIGHDCPRCGQQLVRLDVGDYLENGGTPEKFGDMLDTLIRAHASDCKPRRTKPSPANRRRRGWWWFGKIAPAWMWTLIATSTLIGDPEADTATRVMRAITYALLVAVFVMLTAEMLQVYRRGYMRGRHTAGQDRVIDKNLHPADAYAADADLGIHHHYRRVPVENGEGEGDDARDS